MGESRQCLSFHTWGLWHAHTVEFYQLQIKINPAGERMELDSNVFVLVFRRKPKMPWETRQEDGSSPFRTSWLTTWVMEVVLNWKWVNFSLPFSAVHRLQSNIEPWRFSISRESHFLTQSARALKDKSGIGQIGASQEDMSSIPSIQVKKSGTLIHDCNLSVGK